MLKTFFKILSHGKDYKYWMLFAIVIGFLTVGSGIGLMMTSAYLIAKSAIQTPIFQLQVAIVGVRFFGITRGVFRYFERLISHNVTFKLLAKFRVWFFKSLIPIVPSRTINFSSGDLLTRAVEDIESIEHIFVRVVSPPFIFVATSILMFGLLSQFSLTYSIIFLLMFAASATGIPLLTYMLSKNLGKKIVLYKSQLKALSVDSLNGISELIFYNQTKWETEFHQLNDKLVKTEFKLNNIKSLHESLTGFAMNLTVAVMLLTAIPDIANNLLNGVYLSVITIGIMASFEIVFQIPQAFQYLTKSTEAAKRLFEITDQNNNEFSESGKENEITDFNLKLEDVFFTYDGIRNALSNVSFEIKSGQKIAIVGSSGAGKSTLVNILTRLWNNSDGNIFLGNIDYKSISSDKIREIISVVPQNAQLFTGTIKDNLSIAKESASDDELNDVLKKVSLYELVNSFPDKLDTHIGEFGKKLSGGEIKRLGIARVLLRNSPIMIFDEVTSHLDAINEENILSIIENIKKDKTIIFITHRLNNMQMFDKILLFANGYLIGSGNHSELLSSQILYKKMFELQNQVILNSL